MRVLIGCECSGIVRRAFAALGRAARRSQFFPGLAAAMALQWGGLAAQAA